MLVKRFGIADASRASTGSLRTVDLIATNGPTDGPFTSDGGEHGARASDSRVSILNLCKTALILG